MENSRYMDGFNDALLLIRYANEFDNWDEALNSFGLRDKELKEPTKTNLEEVRKIWETLTC